MGFVEYMVEQYGPAAWSFYLTLAFIFMLELINPDRPMTDAWDRAELRQSITLMFLTSLISFYPAETLRLWYVQTDSYYFQFANYSSYYLNEWASALFGLLLFDLFFYWKHRFFHRSIWWDFHLAHHSAERMNFTVGFRAHPLDAVITTTVFLLIYWPFMNSYNGTLLLLAYGVYQASLHCNSDISFGPLDRIFVSPATHKVHHQTAETSIDRNFASIFSFYDSLFGTYQPPTKDAKGEGYGVVHGPAFKSTLQILLYPFKRRSQHP